MSSSDESDSLPEIESLDISNDQYYQPVAGFTLRLAPINEGYDIPKYGSKTIQHSLPAYDLWRFFFPTYLGEEKAHNFHRPKLRHYNTGPQARLHRRKSKPFPIKSLSRTIYRYQKKLRYKVIAAINSGMTKDEIMNKFLLIHKAKDLSAKRGELFLFEYSEEYPPILSQVGMASNIKNYIQPSAHPTYIKTTLKNNQQEKQNLSNNAESNNNLTDTDSKSRASNTQGLTAIESVQTTNDKPGKIGEDVILNQKTKPIYFNHLKAGQKQQVLENNIFRAPIFPHQFSDCDFLVVRTRNSFYIRTVRTIFTVGQTMPLVLVPQPTENAITRFRLELSNLFIHKLFMESDIEPATINFDVLARLFPDYHMSILQRRLTTNGAIRVKKGPQLLFSRGTSKYGLSTLLELRTSYTPEKYCANMSMLCAMQRLRELNYTESMINPPNDVETEVEVLAAPWNTSKAVMNTISGRCYLDLCKHLIDPTGLQREGFSCVAWTKSPTEDQQMKDRTTGSRSATPTDKLSSIPTKNPLSYKITREKLERLEIYKREASRIAETQANMLKSTEVLTSDEDEDEEVEDENQLDNSFDEQLRDLDKLVSGQTQQELNFEKEEDVRLEMLREFNQNGQPKPKSPVPNSQESDNSTTAPINVAAFKNKVLNIIRTYNSEEGLIHRKEVVRDPKIIALYIKKKGGSISGSQAGNILKNHDNLKYGNNVSQKSDMSGKIGDDRRESTTLGPSELCRADGIVLTISKKVLNRRAMRKDRRESLRSADLTD